LHIPVRKFNNKIQIAGRFRLFTGGGIEDIQAFNLKCRQAGLTFRFISSSVIFTFLNWVAQLTLLLDGESIVIPVYSIKILYGFMQRRSKIYVREYGEHGQEERGTFTLRILGKGEDR